MPKAMNRSRFIGWLYEHGGQQVEVELVNAKTYRGELVVYDEDSDHICLKTDVDEGIPLAAIVRVRPLKGTR
jgi:hypothetical protein